MEIIRIPHIVQDTCKKYRSKGKSMGFVPTMGALHDGHLSLIRRSRDENDITVVSIFVNPLQFGPSEDQEKYPRDIENDLIKLQNEDVDLLFLPDRAHMYPANFSSSVNVENISEKLCGRFRPGHFMGVATVVAKLFNIVNPRRAYFGQKDFQQTVIIRKMAADLNFDIEIIICPTIREEDGLAMSSRNLYLDAKERQAALAAYRALNRAADTIKSGIIKTETIKNLMDSIIREESLVTQIDYASAYNPTTLEELDEIEGEVLLAVAMRLRTTRLIDNIIITQ